MLAQIKPYNPGGAKAVTVCTLTVERDLCVGCGVCVPVCPTQTLRMAWNGRGELIPIDRGFCRAGCHVCVDACPFLDQKHNEDTIAWEDYGAIPDIGYHPESGFYLGLYAGYMIDEEARRRGAAGGLARWLLARLLEKNIADRVLCVVSGGDPEQLVRFAVLDSPAGVRESAKSAYYPTEMSEVVARVLAEEARYAVVALPCYLKGLKLALRQNVKLRRRIVLTAGLVCGQTKSTAFAGYLTRLVGLRPAATDRISFREKDSTKPATELIFQARSGSQTASVSWTEGGGKYKQAYVAGMFKPRCCDFCDDIFAEVADISFMDAWLPEYQHDGRGTNLVLSRSPLAERVLQEGAAEGMLRLEPVTIDRVLLSQDSVIPDKRDWLAYRLYLADECGAPRPHKRIAARKPDFTMRRCMEACERLRLLSHRAWQQQCAASADRLDLYHRRMRGVLRAWRFWTWWRRLPYRYYNAVLRRLRRLSAKLHGPSR